MVAPKSFETEIVHEILPPTLKGDGGEQDSDEAVLGIPVDMEVKATGISIVVPRGTVN